MLSFLLAGSYLPSSSSSASYLLRLACPRTCPQGGNHYYPHRQHTRSISLVVTSRRTVQHPTVSNTLRAALTSQTSPTSSPYLTRSQPPPYRHLPVTSYLPSYLPHLTCSHSCQLHRASHPPPHRHHTHRIMLALVLAAMILTTTLPTDTALVVSHLSSHSPHCMAQHPAVSDTIRAALTSQRLPTYLHRTRCHSRQHDPARHSPYRHLSITSYSLSYLPYLTRYRNCYLCCVHHPLIGIILDLLAIVLAVRVLTTFLFIDSILAVSHSSS